MSALAALLVAVAAGAWLAERLEKRATARRELSRLIAQHTYDR